MKGQVQGQVQGPVKARRAFGAVRWVLFAAGGVLLFLIAAVIYSMLRPVVTVTEVVEGEVVQAFYATGTLQPAHEYPVRSNTAGLLFKPDPTRRYIDKGDAVTEGQPLAVVQDSQLKYLLDKARAELEERRRRADEASSPVLQEFTGRVAVTGELIEIAKREQERVARLLETRASSEGDFDRALNTVKTLTGNLESLKAEKDAMRLQLKRELEVAESALRIAQWNLDQQTLLAPVTGVVLDRPVSLGTPLAINDHVMQIADVRPENLVMRAQVDEEDITRVRVDEKNPQAVKMSLYAFAGKTFEGRVIKIYDKADPDRRTFEVDVAVAAPDPKMAAGMTGELAFIAAERSRVKVVPSQAVQDGALWTVRNGRLHKLEAAIGIRSIERAEVVSGANLGDQIAVSPIGKLTEGRPVRTAHVDPKTAADQNKPKAAETFKGFN